MHGMERERVTLEHQAVRTESLVVFEIEMDVEKVAERASVALRQED